MNVFLIHQYAGNKGDRAVLFAMCKLLREITPTCSITISTSNPQIWDNESYYTENKIHFVPSAWDYDKIKSPKFKILHKFRKYTFTIFREGILRHIPLPLKTLINPQFYRSASDADVIISLGGHHFTTLLSRDIVSSINFDTMAATLFRKPMFAFSQSFGPFCFNNPRNKKISLYLLNSFQTLFIREAHSQSELESLGVIPQIISEVPETVLSLNSLFSQYQRPSERNKEVGISIYSTAQRSQEELKKYINSIATLCLHVISKGYSITFFPMESKGTEPDDRPLISKIIEKADNSSFHFIDKDMRTDEHLQRVAQCRIFIGHKTHSTIFALASGTPLLAIAYHPKTTQFLSQFGHHEDVIEDTKMDTNTLTSMFDSIERRLDKTGLSYFEQSKRETKQIRHILTTSINHIDTSNQ